MMTSGVTIGSMSMEFLSAVVASLTLTRDTSGHLMKTTTQEPMTAATSAADYIG
jgi:hypothetical protein